MVPPESQHCTEEGERDPIKYDTVLSYNPRYVDADFRIIFLIALLGETRKDIHRGCVLTGLDAWKREG